MIRNLWISILGAMFYASVLGAAEVGEGSLKTGALAEGTDVVTVDVEDSQTGESLSGVVRITIPGMQPYVMAGNVGDIVWARDGDAVSGTIVNADGGVVSVISGQISGGQMGGSFSDASGHQGTWEWDGPIPE